MEKLSVNGKTFDEVFAERGVKIRYYKLEIEKYYFCAVDGYNRCVFKKEGKTKLHTTFSNALSIHSDGRVLITTHKNLDNDDICRLRNDWAFYEATPDQIALLELYKSQKP